MKKRHKSKAAREAAERDVELYVRLWVLSMVVDISDFDFLLENSKIKQRSKNIFSEMLSKDRSIYFSARFLSFSSMAIHFSLFSKIGSQSIQVELVSYRYGSALIRTKAK